MTRERALWPTCGTHFWRPPSSPRPMGRSIGPPQPLSLGPPSQGYAKTAQGALPGPRRRPRSKLDRSLKYEADAAAQPTGPVVPPSALSQGGARATMNGPLITSENGRLSLVYAGWGEGSGRLPGVDGRRAPAPLRRRSTDRKVQNPGGHLGCPRDTPRTFLLAQRPGTALTVRTTSTKQGVRHGRSSKRHTPDLRQRRCSAGVVACSGWRMSGLSWNFGGDPVA